MVRLEWRYLRLWKIRFFRRSSDFERFQLLQKCSYMKIWKKAIFGIRVYGFIWPEILIYSWKWIVIHVFRLKEWFWLHWGAFWRFQNFDFEKCLQKIAKKCWKIRKITNFQFWISRPIWQILMICELHKVSITFFDHNPRYWTKNLRIRQKIAFFEVRCHFGPFSHKPQN